ncbi:MAG TPA: hypothetical protein VGY90_04620 [Steroidobacteraceae bacterium]|jgi:hypothetical protein|nr:hypothetical protein [Steroidobacteraceae bacterium]
MSMLLQQCLVGALVIACALFSAWRLSSVRLRLRALDALGAWPGLSRASWLGRLRERTLAQQLRACGGCSAPPGHPAKSRSP